MDCAGLKCLNTYRPSTLKPSNDSAALWLLHVRKFFGGNVQERKVFLDWLAFKVQNPGVKVMWAVILQSAQGIGKGTLAKPLFDIFGRDNCVEVENDELHKGEMAFIENKLLLVINELKAGDKKVVADNLKTIITERRRRVRRLYSNSYEVENLGSVLAFTNHAAPIYLEDSDRRWFVFETAMTRPSANYFDRLHGWLDKDGAAKVHGYLLRRDVSRFNPNAAPPMTAAKLETLEASRGETRNAVIELWDDEMAPFDRPLLNLQDAVEHLRAQGSRFQKLGVENFKRYLRELGAVPYTSRTGGNEAVTYEHHGMKERKRLWVLRARSCDWHDKTAAEIGADVWRPGVVAVDRPEPRPEDFAVDIRRHLRSVS